MSCIEFAWIKKDDRLTIGDGVENVLGWTAAEAENLSLDGLLSFFTAAFLKEYCYGPPVSIVSHAFPAFFQHKGGHEVCCRVMAICRYDESGELAEAWGCVQCCQEQCKLNSLLDWWPQAKAEDLETLAHAQAMYASM